MTFHIHELHQKTKREILEVWEVALEHMDAQDKEIADWRYRALNAEKVVGELNDELFNAESKAYNETEDKLVKLGDEMDVESKDYTKAINTKYRAGYDQGRISILKEIVIALLIVGVSVFLFGGIK